MGGVRWGEEGHAHTHTQEHVHTGMLHLPFSDLPLKKCPIITGKRFTKFHVKGSRPLCFQKVWRKITLVKFKGNLKEIFKGNSKKSKGHLRGNLREM